MWVFYETSTHRSRCTDESKASASQPVQLFEGPKKYEIHVLPFFEPVILSQGFPFGFSTSTLAITLRLHPA